MDYYYAWQRYLERRRIDLGGVLIGLEDEGGGGEGGRISPREQKLLRVHLVKVGG